MKLTPQQEQCTEEGLRILKLYKFCLLAMEARTGKTATSLTIAKRLDAKSILFITKKNAISSIKHDCEKLEIESIDIINYEGLHNIQNRSFDLVIVDEAHALGAFPKPSKRMVLVKRFCTSAKNVLALTGTPNPEGFSKLYHIFWACGAGSLWGQYRNFYGWAKDYVDVTQKTIRGLPVNDYTGAKIDKINPILNKVSVTLSQSEANFTCEVKEIFHNLPMPSQIAQAIKAIKKKRIFKHDGKKATALESITVMQKTHQLCGGAVTCDDGEPLILSNAKARFIKLKFDGKRIAIYYKFKAELDILRSVFEDAGDLHSGKDVVLSQIVSGREGVLLDTYDALVFYNIDFSATSYFQAKARLQSINRKTPAEVHWIFFDGGIESKVYDMVSKKKRFTLHYFER